MTTAATMATSVSAARMKVWTSLLVLFCVLAATSVPVLVLLRGKDVLTGPSELATRWYTTTPIKPCSGLLQCSEFTSCGMVKLATAGHHTLVEQTIVGTPAGPALVCGWVTQP